MAQPNPASGHPPDTGDSRRRHLRPAVVGRDINAWPLAVPRYPDEQFDRWLTRVSHRYAVSLSQIVKAMALPSAPEYGLDAVSAVLMDYEQFTQTLGVPHHDADEPEKPEELVMPAWDALDCLRSLAPDISGRWCPECLSVSGHWRSQWLEWWALACPDHQLELLSCCPSCAKTPWASKSWTFYANPVDRCPEKKPGTQRRDERCGADLTLAKAKPVGPTLLAIQLRFTDLQNRAFEAPAEPIHVGGFTIPRAMYLHALCCTAAAVLRQSESAAEDPHRFLQAIDIAYDLVEKAATGQPSEELDTLLGPSGPLDPLAIYWDTATNTPNPLLTAAALRRRENLMGPGQHLLFRTGRTHPAPPPEWLDVAWRHQVDPRDLLPEHRTVPLTVPAQWVPQQLWPEVIDDIGDDPAARSALAICLLRLGREIHTGAVALELGLPWTSATAIDTEIARLFDDHKWPRLMQAIEHIARELPRAPPPIDYRARRVIGTRPELLDAALTAVHRRFGSERLTIAVKARFWERFTGSDITTAPEELAHNFRGAAYTRYVDTRFEHDLYWDSAFHLALDKLRKTSGLPAIGPLDWEPPWLSGKSRLTAASWQRFPYHALFDDKAADPQSLLAYIVLTALVPDWKSAPYSPAPEETLPSRYRLFDDVPGLLAGPPRPSIFAPYPGEDHFGNMVAHTCGTPPAPSLSLALPRIHRWPHRDA